MSKFGKFLDLENIRSIWPLVLEVPMRTRLRVNRQIKICTQILYMSGCHVTSRIRNDDLALCL